MIKDNIKIIHDFFKLVKGSKKMDISSVFWINNGPFIQFADTGVYFKYCI